MSKQTSWILSDNQSFFDEIALPLPDSKAKLKERKIPKQPTVRNPRDKRSPTSSSEEFKRFLIDNHGESAGNRQSHSH